MTSAILAALLFSQTGQLVSGFCPVGVGCPKVIAVKVLDDGSVVTSGGGGGGTVDQGLGGLSPWLVYWTTPGPVTQSGTWTVQQGTPPWSVSGTVTANQGGAWTVQQGTPPWSVSGTVAASQSGAWTVQQGTPPWSVTFPSAQPVSGTVTANQGTSPWVVSGTVTANVVPGTTATASNSGTCTSVTASTTVLAANASRRVASIYNSPTSTANVHVKLGATATVANPPIVPGQSINIEASTIYTGVVDAIASTGTQTVCVYEW